MTIVSERAVMLTGREPAANRCFDRLIDRGASAHEAATIVGRIYPELSGQFLDWLQGQP